MVVHVNPARADDAPELNFIVTAKNLSGRVSDGFVIGKGRVIYRPTHNGFVIWSQARNAGSPQKYILEGQRNTRNELKVRIESDRGLPDTERGKGIMVLSSEVQVPFTVVVDGEQQVRADRYDIQMNAAVIFP